MVEAAFQEDGVKDLGEGRTVLGVVVAEQGLLEERDSIAAHASRIELELGIERCDGRGS